MMFGFAETNKMRQWNLIDLHGMGVKASIEIAQKWKKRHVQLAIGGGKVWSREKEHYLCAMVVFFFSIFVTIYL